MRSAGRVLFGSKARIAMSSACAVLLIAASVIAFIVLHGSTPIPSVIASKITFPIYYPKGSPGNFVIDRERISYDETSTVLQMPAANSLNGHNVTISEQAMPSKLTFDDLKGQGTLIDDALGQAAVSSVEGRMVASMISADRKTLILINSANATKEELTALIKSLKPLN